MISRQIKPLAILESTISPMIIEHKGESWMMIRKGYEPHYQWVQRHRRSIKDKKIVCYEHEKVSIALEMAIMETNCVTYVDTRRYETVSIVSKSKNQVSYRSYNSFSNMPQDIGQKALSILKNFNFLVRASFLDIHPLIAY